MFDAVRRVFGVVAVSVLIGARAQAAAPGDVPVLLQDAKLVASDVDEGDQFGSALAVSGDTLLVGSGVAGPGIDSGPGEVHVLVRSGSRWTEQALLLSPDPDSGDQFGASVAIDGDTALVGAWGDDTASLNSSGAAYVFVRSGTAWSVQQKLVAPAPGPADFFGWSVSLSGDTALVSCHLDDLPLGNDAGSAHVFVRSGGLWSHQATLVADDGGFDDEFGYALTLSGDTAVVTAMRYDLPGVENVGAAYVFVRSGATWMKQAQLIGPGGTAWDEFGLSAALEGNTLVVGAPGENTQGFSNAGGAYIFARTGDVWSQQAQLLDSAPDVGDVFGMSVALRGDTVVVGTPNDDKGSMDSTGSAFVFTRDGASWVAVTKLEASDPRPLDTLGSRVAASSEFAFAGAPQANAPALDDVGAAYVFDVGGLIDPWVDLGFGLAGAGGVPSLVGTGTLVAGSPGTLVLSGAHPSAAAILFISFASTPAPFKGGTLVPVPVALSLALVTNGLGGLPLSWAAWPGGLPAGTPLYFQYGIHDAGAPFGTAISNALKASVP